MKESPELIDDIKRMDRIVSLRKQIEQYQLALKEIEFQVQRIQNMNGYQHCDESTWLGPALWEVTETCKLARAKADRMQAAHEALWRA